MKILINLLNWLYQYSQKFPPIEYSYNLVQTRYFIIYDNADELLASIVFVINKLNSSAWKAEVKFTRNGKNVTIEVSKINWVMFTRTDNDSSRIFTLENYSDPKDLKPIEKNNIKKIDVTIKEFIALIKQNY